MCATASRRRRVPRIVDWHPVWPPRVAGVATGKQDVLCRWLCSKLRNGRLRRPVVLSLRIVVLDACAAAVIALELSEVAGLVGQDRLKVMPVVVGEGELRAEVRRLAANDHRRALGAAGQLEVLGDHRDLPVGACPVGPELTGRPSRARRS